MGCRTLAWIVILTSDLYLCIVLLLAALQSDDEGFLDRHSWMTGFLPRRRTAGIVVVMLLFLAVISGFGGLYQFKREIFASHQNPARCFLHQFLYVSLDRLLAETWLWSTCSARPARQQRSLACCTFSLAHLTNLDFQAPMKPVPRTLQEGAPHFERDTGR